MMEHTAIAEARKRLDQMRDVLAIDLREPANPEQAAELRRWREKLALRVVDLGEWIEREQPFFQV